MPTLQLQSANEVKPQTGFSAGTEACQPVSEGINHLTPRPRRGVKLPDWTAGAHVDDLLLGKGLGHPIQPLRIAK
jgi:hypothetical protein